MLIDDILEDLRAEERTIDDALSEIRRRASEESEALDLPTLHERVNQSQQKGLLPAHARQIRHCLDGAMSAMEHRFQEKPQENFDDWGDYELELTLEPIDEPVPKDERSETGEEETGSEDEEEEKDGLELPPLNRPSADSGRPAEAPSTPAAQNPSEDDSGPHNSGDEHPGENGAAEGLPSVEDDPDADHEVILETGKDHHSERFESEEEEQAFYTTMVGALLGGRFELLNRISQDPYGTVYRARDHERDVDDAEAQLCAVRVLPSALSKQSKVVDRVEAVVRRMQRLQHRNLLTQRELYRDGDQAWLVSPLPPGGTLARFIRRECVKGLPLDRVLKIVREIAEALHAAHAQDVAHGDLKPASIYIGENDEIKVGDFGLRMALFGKQSPAGQAGSTEMEQMEPIDAYRSMEAMEGSPPQPSDDIYALACIAATLLTGSHPFNGQSGLRRMERNTSLPRIRGLSGNQNRVLKRAAAIQREDRPDSVMAFLADLESRHGELPKKQIGVGVAAVIALAAAWFPLQIWLDHRDQQSQINEILDADWNETRGILNLLDDDELASMRDDLGNSLVPQYASRVRDHLADEEPLDAADLLAEGRRYFPESETLLTLQGEVEESREQLSQETATQLRNRLDAGDLVARDDEMDAPELVGRLERLAPNHELVDSDFLKQQYRQAAIRAVEAADMDQVEGLLDAAQALFDDKTLEQALREAQAEAETRRSEQALETLAPRLADQLPPENLADIEALSENWQALQRMSGHHPLFAEHNEAVMSILSASINELIAAGHWSQANDELREYAPLWVSDELRAQRRELTRLQLAANYRPASLRAERQGLNERRARVEALIEEPRMTPVWSGELVIAWRDMLAWMRPGRDWLTDLRDEIETLYVTAIEAQIEDGDLERAEQLAREGLAVTAELRELNRYVSP
ncbi:serine/threonine protein kinase [Natronospira proteinivora]|uniref:Serine/threonine protein kinase n=1 Tax=Natronospira proteinivora TaxID=1807133 RepID=A0ABT1GAR5_9GAMM|nr:serine/threonine-protein kinase [Natronospira proteinivora]MCP1727012.1 serine/threonine protein kinase [Natronospira proteinivora]